MNKILKKGFYFIIITFLVSCGTNRMTINNIEVNTYPNSEYKKSRKIYSGTLNKYEYNELIKKLETELNSTIPNGKSILVNFNQKAPNCISVRFDKESNSQVARNRIWTSSRMSSNNNAIDFFVYTQDSFNKEIYEKLTEFIPDSGFFYNEVFTEHQNCAGFFILKPDGTFYKYYGEDYYSDVKEILERK